MTATTFQLFVLAVLAVEIIGDLGLSRAELGLIGSINTASGALSAPFTGRLTDRIGAWSSAVAALAVSAIGLAVMAAAPNALVLSLSALITGLPQGWGNPLTNALIAERVAPGAQGTITGIKQSGVQFGVFLSGLTLPTLAIWFGWRGSLLVYCGAFALGALGTAIFLPRNPLGFIGDPAATVPSDAVSQTPSTTAPRQPPDAALPAVMDPWIWRLALYALLMGLVGGVVGRFFPLWAEESIGISTTAAGMIVAMTGLLGILARIAAARVAENLIEPTRLLRILAATGGLYVVLLLITPAFGTWLLWAGTPLNAVGIGAWNAVAMLAIIMLVPKLLAGRASGVVMLGFLGGLSISAPIAGWVVDRTESYQSVWITCVVLALLAMISLSSPSETGQSPRLDQPPST